MAEEEKNTSGTQGEGKQTLSSEAIAELQEENTTLKAKQKDLNQGIAKYRDDSQTSIKQVEDLKKTNADLEAKLKGSTEDVKLSDEEQKKFDAIISKKGLVTKEELSKERKVEFQETQKGIKNEAISAFLKKNPQYDSDEAWTEINKLFILYKTPTTKQGYSNVLSRIHKELSGGTSEEKGANKLRAKIATKSRLSLGGGSQKTGDSDITEDLQKKYPNLSKEQIEIRGEELDELLKKEEKE